MAAAIPDLQMWITLGLVLATMVMLSLERVPLEVTGVSLIGVLMVVFHFLPVIDEAGANRLDAARLLSGFANPGLITVLALLVIGQAMIRTGALEGVAASLHRFSRGSVQRGLAISLVPVAGISSVLNNTPVVVIFIPIVSAFAERLGVAVSRMLIPLSFASILGGMTTLIGSSTNLLVAGVALDLALPPIGFFDFLVPGSVLAVVGLCYVLFVAPLLIPDRAAMAGQLGASGRQFMAQVEVLPDSPLIGERPVAGLFRSLPDMTVRMVQRGEHAFLPPLERVELQVGDVIVVAAIRKVLAAALKTHARALHPSLTRGQIDSPDADDPDEDSEDAATEPWHGGDQVLAEVMVSPASRMVGRDLEAIGFRRQYRCIVLGIQRRSRMIRQRVTEIRLEAGDVLLIQGPPDNVRALRDNRDVVLMEWSQSMLPSYFHARRAALIFAAVVGLAAANVIPIVVAAVAGAAAMILTGCLNVRQAARALDGKIAMTVAATLALGAALQETGGAAFVAHGLVAAVGGAGPGIAMSVLFLVIAVVTNVLSNNA
ncbi:MAG: SLC13 family permease, partial [Alphaproteobacteria bacterium]|nr:SLC13 family permease [Alphaproteobacteria bacterium]